MDNARSNHNQLYIYNNAKDLVSDNTSKGNDKETILINNNENLIGNVSNGSN